jgi:NAD(P)-dependent dehydrogenase (short-subunit alcohol dehydrogenase family)
MSDAARPLPAALITGASTGIGEACAVELARRGWRVFAGVRRDEDAERLRRLGPAVEPLRLDVTVAEQVAAAAERLRAELDGSGLAGLVNNAGIALGGPLETLPLDEIRRPFEVNVFGLLAVTQAVLPLLRQARGRIVNVSSVSGLVAGPYFGPYAASKFAVEALSDSLRLELRRFGVRVALVEPGPVRTPIWEKAKADSLRIHERMPPEAEALYGDDLAAFQKAVERAAASGAPVERVVRCVVHALSARRPKTRYLLDWPTRAMMAAVRILPDAWRDWFVLKSCGL